MLDIVSCIVGGQFIQPLRGRVCVFTVPFHQGVSQEFAVRREEFAASFAERVCRLSVNDISDIPGTGREANYHVSNSFSSIHSFRRVQVGRIRAIQ